MKNLVRVVLADEPALRSGPVLIEPARRRLVHEDGREAVMDPRAMKVLVAVMRAPGEVLSRDDLFESCWEGRAVSDDAVDRAVSRARRVLREIADGTIAIETVTKVGYRAQVAPRAPPRPALPPRDAAPGAGRRRIWAITIAAALILSLAAGWWATRPSAARPVSAVGIAAFTGAGPADDALGLGLSDQIRARLAGRSDLRIVSLDPRGESLGDERAVAALGARLGLLYVVRGAIERRGETLRMTVRLVDTRDGRPVWSGDEHGPVRELGALQDRVSSGLASALGLRLQAPRVAVSGEAESLYLTARGLLRSRRPERVLTAVDLLEEAVAREPEFAAAWARLAAATELAANDGDPGQRQARRDDALRHARRAIALDPDLADAHGAMGMILGFESDAAAAHIRRAASLDPNDPEIQLWRGHVYGRDLDYAAQLAAYRRAIQLDPLWLYAAWQFVETATALGLNDEAEAEALRFIRTADSSGGHRMRAALASARGNLAEAARQLETLRHIPGPSRQFADVALAETLRAAGLPSLARRYRPGPNPGWTIRNDPVPGAEAIRAWLAATADNSEQA